MAGATHLGPPCQGLLYPQSLVKSLLESALAYISTVTAYLSCVQGIAPKRSYTREHPPTRRMEARYAGAKWKINGQAEHGREVCAAGDAGLHIAAAAQLLGLQRPRGVARHWRAHVAPGSDVTSRNVHVISCILCCFWRGEQLEQGLIRGASGWDGH